MVSDGIQPREVIVINQPGTSAMDLAPYRDWLGVMKVKVTPATAGTADEPGAPGSIVIELYDRDLG